jgi:hypothetical protein
MCVNVSEALSEGPADRSDRELHELVPIHRDRTGRKRGDGSAIGRKGPNQFLLPGVLALSELLGPLRGSQERFVGPDRGLGCSDGFAQFGGDDS